MSDIFESSETVQPAESVRKYRRIVTRITEDGKDVIAEDALCPHQLVFGGIDTMVSTEFWKTENTPSRNNQPYEDKEAGFTFNPASTGSLVRILEIPPVTAYASDDAPLDFHRTATLDYAVVLEGECTLSLGEEETTVKAGDVVIQQGTIHAWTNHSDKPCRIFFVMCGAEPVPGLEIL